MEQEVGRGCHLVTIEARFTAADGAAGSTNNAVVLEEMGDTIAGAGAHHAVKESLGNDDMRRGDVEPEKNGEDGVEKASAGSEKEYNTTVAEVERLREELESLKRKVEEIQAGKETARGATREKDAQTIKLRAELEELHAFISRLQTARLNRYGDCAHWTSTDEDSPKKASLAANENGLEWVLDSEASRHVAGKSCILESYNKHPPSHTSTIQTADYTKQPVIGVGTVKCTRTISLSSVLHVPAFPVNLVSFSALIDQIDCRVILDKFGCEIKDPQTKQAVGTGTKRRGLWYMDQGVQPDLICAATMKDKDATMKDKEKQAMIHHYRMGHVSFDKMSRIFPDVMCRIGKGRLTCDACE